MKENRILFEEMLTRYQQQECTEAERLFVEQYMQMVEAGVDLNELSEADIVRVEMKVAAALKASMQAEEEPIAPVHRVHFLRRIRWAAAAVLLLIAGAGGWWYINHSSNQENVVVYKGNVAPGRPGAKLKLSDGRMILVDSLKDGFIAMDGAVKISKQNGRIVYEGVAETIAYNEVFADKGQETSAQLPDGSIVYLNAGSSLKYPLRFEGKERLVEMTGEVYFEVVHNEKMPFKVKAGNQVIEDLGTVFNVNSYADEPEAITTLVEGAIKIAGEILKPGEQYADGKVSKADISKAIAWHKGLFSFRHSNIPTIMRQLSRWYNVEVRYEGKVSDESFTGDINRSLSLAEVLDVLKQTGVKFKIEEDRRIVILP